MEKKISQPQEPQESFCKPCDYFVISVQSSPAVPPHHVVCLTSVSLGQTVAGILDNNPHALCIISRGSRPDPE